MPPLLNADTRHVLHRLESQGGFRASARGWSCRCPCTGHANGDRHPSGWVWLEAGRLNVHCFAYPYAHTWKQWAAELEREGIPKSAWFLEPRGQSKPAEPEQIVSTFTYRDDRGKEVYRVRRTNWKRMWHEREFAAYDDQTVTLLGMGEGYYVKWNQDPYDRRWKFHHATQLPDRKVPRLRAPECERVLYRLPEILEAPFEEPVFVVEGEKKVDCLRPHGIVATCNSGGAGHITAEQLKWLQDRPVVVIPDMNEVGYKHAALVGGLAMMVGAASVTVAHWAPHEVGPGGDIYDWVKELADRDVYSAVRRRFFEEGIPHRPETRPRTFAQVPEEVPI